ncbi:MAG: enoyl-CoA hydratase/isomerase family protein [Alphaproteobacteria bacterium]|nr:enoyl-CoA hydratase/isomerase family protein [Alphaproteobacteria bacterium]
MEFKTIIVEQNDGVGILTLNRPASLNAICASMAGELIQALDDFSADETIKCILLKGAGASFAAGTDVAEMGGDFSPDVYLDLNKKINDFSKPIIAAVSGYAFGAGFELVLSSDIIVSSHDARFGFPEITIGMLPFMGGISKLKAKAGTAKASELLMTARHISADEALACGIVSRIVDRIELDEQAMDTAKKIAGASDKAIKMLKRALSTETSPVAEFSMAVLALQSAEVQQKISSLNANQVSNLKKE